MLDVRIDRKDFRRAGGGTITAIEGLAFEVPEGSFACLVGPSGCGKTTTLRLILQLDRQFEGNIRTPAGRAAAVFQEPRLLPWRTVAENVQLSLPPELAGSSQAQLFELLGLAGMENLYPGELSLGMARRVALARAFAMEPALLTLDEPFVSLDDATAARMRRLLLQVWSARHTTALMVTHNLVEACELADRIIVISRRPGHVRGVQDIGIPRERRCASTIADLVADILKRWPPEQ